uniref:Uncharacterized protein n=1 Tax=Arundo donax TaxID=35708 RepID=A0A0A8XZI5_ARUDO
MRRCGSAYCPALRSPSPPQPSS